MLAMMVDLEDDDEWAMADELEDDDFDRYGPGDHSTISLGGKIKYSDKSDKMNKY